MIDQFLLSIGSSFPNEGFSNNHKRWNCGSWFLYNVHCLKTSAFPAQLFTSVTCSVLTIPSAHFPFERGTYINQILALQIVIVVNWKIPIGGKIYIFNVQPLRHRRCLSGNLFSLWPGGTHKFPKRGDERFSQKIKKRWFVKSQKNNEERARRIF